MDLSPEFKAELRRIKRKLDGISGPGVRHCADSIYIGAPGKKKQPKPRRQTDGVFPVRVEKTGGLDGTKTTAATWTYTVRRIDWTDAENQTSADFELGTVVILVRPRPFGKATFQEDSLGYGIAFYTAGVLQLWDAGEIYGTGGC